MDLIKNYIDELIEKSSPDKPMWNIESILSGNRVKWNYIDGCMIKAILEMYYNTNEKKYVNFADTFIDYYINDDGSIKGYSKADFNIDSINEGKVLFDLFELTKKEKYRKAIDVLYQQLQEHPRTKSNNFWHKLIYPNQIWLDGLYMAQPFYMEYETKYNGYKNYKDIYQQIMNVRKLMFNEEKKLYYHGYDESREMFWCNKETGLSKNFWVRSMGWYVMSLVDVLEKMDNQMFYEYRQIIDVLREAIDGLLQYQDNSGMFYQVIDQKEKAGNYLETSGSAMIAYAILKSVRLEYLPNNYRKYGVNCFNGIKDKYLNIENGTLSLGGICLVAGLGGKQMRDGSYDYYISEPVVLNDAKGVGPFLLAYTEMIKIDK